MEKQQLDKSTEEIDLIHLFNSFANIISRYFRLISTNLAYFLVIFVIAGAIVHGCQSLLPRSYATKGVFVTRLLPGSYCDFLVNGINEDLKDQNYSAIATNLHVSRGTAAEILHISSQTMARDSGLLDKADPDAAGFAVNLRLKNIENLDSIQIGLVRYLQENDFAIRRKEAQRKNLTALIGRLDERMKSLDSLKKTLNNRYANTTREQGIIFGEPADPVSVYKEEMGYYKEQIYLNDRLTNLDHSIEVFEPFVKQEIRNYPNIRPILLLSIAAGLLAALIATPLYGLKKARKKRYSV
jgi:hypothetical protein